MGSILCRALWVDVVCCLFIVGLFRVYSYVAQHYCAPFLLCLKAETEVSESFRVGGCQSFLWQAPNHGAGAKLVPPGCSDKDVVPII